MAKLSTMEVSPSLEFDEDEMESFFKELANSLETNTRSPPDQNSKERILKALTDLKIMFSMPPTEADHPPNRSALHEAVEVLSVVDKSYGLADDQVERVRHLVSTWSLIVDQAAAANKSKEEAEERLSTHASIISSLRDTMSRQNDMNEQYKNLEVESEELHRQIQELKDRLEAVKYKREEHKKERGKTLAEAKQLKVQYDRIKVDAPKLKEKLEEAAKTLDKAQGQWVELKNTLDEVSAVFV